MGDARQGNDLLTTEPSLVTSCRDTGKSVSKINEVGFSVDESFLQGRQT